MKRIIGLALAILLVTGVAGVMSAAPIPISFMTWDSGVGFDITQKAVDAFQKKFPNVTVELQSVPQGYDEKVMTANAAGNTPDGLLMWNTSQFAEAGVVESLSPYIAKDKYDMGKFLPVLKAWTEYKGNVWGLPKDWTPRVIWYNKKVFDDAGVAYPQDGWTWADFTATVKKLTNGKTGRDARYGYVAIPGHTYAIQQYIWSNGGDLVSRDGRTASGYINSPKVVEVVKWYKGLYDMSITTGTQDQYQNLGQTEFQSGVVGMMDNGVWPLATFKDDKSLSFDVVSPPVPKKGAALKPIIHSATWSMFAKAKNKDATWQLIKYLADPEGLRILTAGFWAIPSIPSISQEMGFTKDPILKKFVAVGSKPTIAPVFVRNPKWFEADNEFLAALQKIFISGADIQSTLDAAAAKMDKILQGAMHSRSRDRGAAAPRSCFGREGVGHTMRQIGATTRERLSGILFISPWLIGFIAFYAGPMLFSFAVSFTNWDFFKNMTFIGLRNYFADGSPDEYALPGLLKTFLFVGLEVPLQLVGALLIAQLLTRKLRGVNLARSLVYLPAVISGRAGGLIWRFMLGKQTGIFNYFLSFFGVRPIPWIDDPHYALFSIISIGLWAVGQPMILFLAALQGVPQVFYEAAEVDGASASRKFFRITLPMISPTILLNVIIIMINQFQMLAPLIVITSGGPARATYLYSYVEYDNAFRFMKMGYASALSWFMFVIMLVITLLLFRSSRRWVYSYSERGDIL